MKKNILYWSPRILSIMFVSVMVLLSLDVSPSSEQFILGTIIHLMVPLVVLLVSILAWKRNFFGMISFFLIAVYYIFMVGIDRHWSWYLSIPGPALLISILFFFNWRSGK
ncbi:MAG: hypothetical protein MNSN_00680 [Minisyncoccus archaeiphilus]|uniref:DUF7670 domain-containing protein n=1 Tax=Minisyncoccus archaeiphilus TaxID=3238481 RepID=UPI002B0BFE3F|nr:MAG: hypothetical protein MNSN_00680 [Candidatus Parcubacteria bacterium]